MSYSLTLTAEDVEAIAHVGRRYSWSAALLSLAEGQNEIPEHEAWEIREAFEADMEGGHSPFPMLLPESELHAKLLRLWEEIV